MLAVEIGSILLQIFAAASVLGAAALWVFHVQKVGQRAPQPLPELAPRPGRWRLLGWAALAAIGSRLVLCALAWVVVHPGGGAPMPSMESIWSKWDAPHYLDIVRLGYTADRSLGDQWLFIVFYPLYPLLTAALAPVLGGPFPAATALSWGCLVFTCYWLYRLAALDGDRAEAARAVKYLLLFPAAVFLGAPYTESLFLLLTVLCLYALRRRRWALAGALGFLAALTRNVGVLLAVPFLIELLDDQGALAQPKKLLHREFWASFVRAAPWMLLIPLGLVVYLLLNLGVYGDAFQFLKIQDDHWGQHAQPFFQTVATTYLNLFSYDDATKLFLWGPQLLGMVAVLAALPLLLRRMRPSYGAYLLVYTVVALSPSWLLSFNRYMMGAVPLLLGLAAVTRKKWLDAVLSLLFLALMLYLTLGYLTGRMVV